jgi:polyisoprenoid-binding protein YceI
MRKTLTVSLLAAALAGFATAAEMKIAPSTSKIEFIGTKTGGKHTGGFKDFTGTVDVPGADIAAAKITIEISAGSIYTDTPKLTNHLKSGDFFDVNKHPKATFKSTAIKAAAGANGTTHEITGDLTMHGVTKSITFPVKTTSDDKGVTIDGTLTVKKEDFGMVYGKGIINNDVPVTFTIKAAK